MNFIEACKKIQEGKLVRRESWHCSSGTDHVGYDGSLYYRTNLKHEGGHVTCHFNVGMNDVLATDWVVVMDKGKDK